MSSKKAPKKETKPAARKAAEKKPVAKAVAKPAKAAEKKPAPKTAEKKPVTKAAAKPAKAAEKKSAAKTGTASVVKKVAAKTAEKNVKSVPAKETAKSKATEKKPVAKAAEKKPAAKVVAKQEKPSAKPKTKTTSSKVVSPKDVKNASAKSKKAEDKKAAVAIEIETKTSENATAKLNSEKVSSDSGKTPKKLNDYDFAILLEGVKKLSKSIMFVEVDEQEDRSNKKKMSSEMKSLDMKPTASIRRKASLAEETQEELTERILKELEEQNKTFEREAATQMCTRCNRNLVSPEFWVDKHLGYCEECAFILKLGQSKEARKVEYQLGGMGDSLDEEDDEEIVGPDADDLKDAEEDLAEMDDN